MSNFAFAQRQDGRFHGSKVKHPRDSAAEHRFLARWAGAAEEKGRLTGARGAPALRELSRPARSEGYFRGPVGVHAVLKPAAESAGLVGRLPAFDTRTTRFDGEVHLEAADAESFPVDDEERFNLRAPLARRGPGARGSCGRLTDGGIHVFHASHYSLFERGGPRLSFDHSEGIALWGSGNRARRNVKDAIRVSSVPPYSRVAPRWPRSHPGTRFPRVARNAGAASKDRLDSPGIRKGARWWKGVVRAPGSSKNSGNRRG